MEKAGIDTSSFGAHSTRGAATSAAKSLGLSISDIMSAANWSRESTFKKFYCRLTLSNSMGKALLGAYQTKVHCISL